VVRLAATALPAEKWCRSPFGKIVTVTIFLALCPTRHSAAADGGIKTSYRTALCKSSDP
jgi:hypothetical protein